MLTLFIVAVVNLLVWFILGFKLGKEFGQYSDGPAIQNDNRRHRALTFRPVKKIIAKNNSHENEIHNPS
jgi:hypothetical protein